MGLALLMAGDRLSEGSRRFPGYARGLAKADLAIVIVEAAVAGGFVVSVGASGAGGTPTALAAAASLARLLTGDLAVAFWGSFVACGLGGAAACRSGLDVIGPSCAFGCGRRVGSDSAGGFFLRWCVVEAGAHPAVMTFSGVM